MESPAEEPQAVLPQPLARLQAVAASAEPSDIVAFKPSSIHHAIAGVLFESKHIPVSLVELAKMAGVKHSHMVSIYNNPAACSWIISRAANIARFGLAAVFAHHLRMALTSVKPAWTKLFYERFDPEYNQAQANANGKGQSIVFDFSGWSTEELASFVQQKKRLKFGSDSPASAS